LADNRGLGKTARDRAAVRSGPGRRWPSSRRPRAKFRVALTGTPLENHLGERRNLFAVVVPGLLGSWDQFHDRFASPIERSRDPDARAALARVIRPFLLPRTKPEAARELPARCEVVVRSRLSEQSARRMRTPPTATFRWAGAAVAVVTALGCG
jgi:hypothetical protein